MHPLAVSIFISLGLAIPFVQQPTHNLLSSGPAHLDDLIDNFSKHLSTIISKSSQDKNTSKFFRSRYDVKKDWTSSTAGCTNLGYYSPITGLATEMNNGADKEVNASTTFEFSPNMTLKEKYSTILRGQKQTPKDEKSWIVGILVSVVGHYHDAIETGSYMSPTFFLINPQCVCQKGLKDISEVGGTPVTKAVCEELPQKFTYSQLINYSSLSTLSMLLLPEDKQRLNEMGIKALIEEMKGEIAKVWGITLEKNGTKADAGMSPKTLKRRMESYKVS